MTVGARWTVRILTAMSKRPVNPVRFTIAMGLLTFLVFSALVGLLAPGEFWGAISTFIATLISVIGAFFIGVGLYNSQVRIADAKRVEQLSEVLVSELSGTIDALKRAAEHKVEPPSPQWDTVPVTYVQPIILEDAARSGLFNTEVTKKMLLLARTVHLYNLRVSQLFSLLSAGGFQAGWDYHHYQITSAGQAIRDHRVTVINQSEDLIGIIRSGDHVVPDPWEVVEDKRPWYRQLIGW